jgi:hypothetical protein
MFDEWADEMRRTHSELDDASSTAFRDRMFSGDFVFTVDRDFVRSYMTPLLVMPGGDDFHPRAEAEEIVALAPDPVLLSSWGAMSTAPTPCTGSSTSSPPNTPGEV